MKPFLIFTCLPFRGPTEVALWYSMRDLASQMDFDSTVETDGLHMPDSVVSEVSRTVSLFNG